MQILGPGSSMINSLGLIYTTTMEFVRGLVDVEASFATVLLI